ncbi:MAG: integrase arm-type DNA-binding domain-containing protein [Terracidiphilus sp.]
MKPPKAAGELSNIQCQKAGAKVAPYRLTDKGGLALLITPEGGKLWRWRYRFKGVARQMAFGKYPDVPLADARSYHADARKLLANGVDPMALRKETKEQEKVELAKAAVEEPKALTFGALTLLWYDWWKKGMNAKYAKNVLVRLEGDIIAKVGTRLPAEITRMEWVQVTQAVDSRGARDIAKRNLQFVKAIYDWGLDNGHLDQNALNPAAGIKPQKILSKVVEEHFASLPIQEIPELLRKMRDYNGSAVTRIAMELMNLTFLRTGELIGGLWPEIDWKWKMWRVPAERMKMKRLHLVPLATQSIALLERLRSITGESGRLFPVEGDGPGFMSKNTILQALGHMGYKGRMTGHGWRTVAGTFLREKRFNADHIEVQLSHSKKSKDQVAAVYDQAKYIDDRIVMMQFWADSLDELREGKTEIIEYALKEGRE